MLYLEAHRKRTRDSSWQGIVEKFWLKMKKNVTMRILTHGGRYLGKLWSLQPWKCSKVDLKKTQSNLL